MRIRFPGNPWPEGHAIEQFRWTAKVRGGDVWFQLHLKTADYYAERDIEDDEDAEYASDWQAPIVWGNYHSCTISSSEWHDGGFRLCPVDAYSMELLNGLEVHVDSMPCDLDDPDALAFHTYLLGHDTVLDHRIQFTRVPGTRTFDIDWSGKIALTYAGDYEPRYSFHAQINAVQAPELASVQGRGTRA